MPCIVRARNQPTGAEIIAKMINYIYTYVVINVVSDDTRY